MTRTTGCDLLWYSGYVIIKKYKLVKETHKLQKNVCFKHKYKGYDQINFLTLIYFNKPTFKLIDYISGSQISL